YLAAGVADLPPGRVVQLDAVAQPAGPCPLLRLARGEDLAAGGGRRGTLDPGDEAADVRAELVLVPGEGGVDEDAEHAVGDAGFLWVAAAAAGERAGEHLGDDAEGVALVAAHRQDGARRRAVQRLRVVGRPAVAVEHAVVGQGHTLVEGDAD